MPHHAGLPPILKEKIHMVILQKTLVSILTVCMILHAVGCSSYTAVSRSGFTTDMDTSESSMRIILPGGFSYEFPKGQYTLSYEGSKVDLIRGWGDKFGPYGLIDRGYFVVQLEENTILELEEVDVPRSLLFAGGFTAVGILTFLGIKSAVAAAGGKDSQRSSPTPAN